MKFSLVGRSFTWPVVAITVSLIIASLFPLTRHRVKLIGIVAAVSLVVTVIALHIATAVGWIVPALPLSTQPWVWAAFFALGWIGVGWRSGKIRSRVLAGVAVPVSIVMALVLFNAYFYYWPTFGDVVGHAPTDRASRDQVRTVLRLGRHGVPTTVPGSVPGSSPTLVDPVFEKYRSAPHGLVLPAVFPATTSQFVARPGWVYLPPAWWGPERSKLPVIELFGGTPSSPLEWLRGANAQGASDAFAAQNNGMAPILVMVDDNGTFTGDTECVDRPGYLAETYAITDVRNAMVKRFGVTADPRRWGVAGLSEGGMCALAIGLRHPDKVRVIGDFGGEPTQRLGGNHQTLQELFNGSIALQQSYDPNTLLRRGRYDGMSAMFVSGSGDNNLRTLKQQAALAKAAGMNVSFRVVPGGHTYRVWGMAMNLFIPFAWEALAPDLASGRPLAPMTTKRQSTRREGETFHSVDHTVPKGPTTTLRR